MSLALVTGGQRGIGLAISRAFAAAGHDVVIADLGKDRDGDALRAAWGTEGRVHCAIADIGNPAAVDALFDEIGTQFDRPADILVNNAAIQFWCSLLELSLDDWKKTLRVNLTGAFLMTQRFARRRLALSSTTAHSSDVLPGDGFPSGGVIINIGSGCNRLAFPKLVSYTASKGGLEMLTKVSALELGPYGIRVNGIAPGSIETERTKAETADYADQWAPLTPLRRVGTVDDVADAVVALSGEGMRFVSGETLAVDGGLFCAAPWPRDY